ncbi:phosphohistidine phosphatase [Ignicoccus islandicus DSM 13165]|uniref:Phosphohistidine phosphatase n=1 Tax=Ignicoccus islandicus DSM 13165 TaxID=940295 RepID=A0A0U3G006_9CREN|nr:histidine phosphatase family protein [Ignicoccus islandicus]ALU11660.1 phosphohistidine phosphatase [Ignicoccus islandicus DSM 13165]
MVIIMLMRHGKAEPKSESKPDEERGLTEEGRREIKAVAKCLTRPSIIYTSPLKRAMETASIIAEFFKNVRVEKADFLAPGKLNLGVLLESVHPGALYISHNPQLEEVLGELKINVEMKPASVAILDLMKRKLIALLNPSFCIECERALTDSSE